MIGNLKNFGMGEDPILGVDADTDEIVGEVLAETGLFKEKTEYIIVGDEVRGSAVFNLKSQLSAESYAQLKQFLTFVPRQHLHDWFMETVQHQLPSPMADAQDPFFTDPITGKIHQKRGFEDFIWASFIDLFNEANLEYINQAQIDPWTWEQEKMEAFLMSKAKGEIEAIEDDISRFTEQGLESDPEARTILVRFAELPKLGDTGLEINRQNVIRQLLMTGDYKLAEAVVDVFSFLDESDLKEVLKAPIPFDIVTGDGQTVKKTE